MGTWEGEGFKNQLPKNYERQYRTIIAEVSAYTLSVDETDSTPFVGACNCDLSREERPIACPASIPIGGVVEIDNINYRCLDRMGRRFRMGKFFDILVEDKATAFKYGRQIKEIKIYE